MNKNDVLVLFLNINALNNDILFKKYYDLVDCERKMKITKSTTKIAKNQILGAFILLSEGLRRLNIKDEIIYNENQKPYLLNNEVYFNISHSYDYVVCVFSKNEIGCDLEKIRDFNEKVAKHFFSISEYQKILNSENKEELFYKYWTKKESIIKALGLDLLKNINNLNEDYNLDTCYLENINNYSLAISAKKIAKIEIEEIKIEV